MIADIQMQDAIAVTPEEIIIVQDAELLYVGGGSNSGCLV